MQQFKFLHKRSEIFDYVTTVQKEADKEKKSLGFLSLKAYQSAAYSEKIIVAVTNPGKEYAGHIFYGGVFPHARVFQTLVNNKFRRMGLASALIEKLISHLEKQSFSSISAKVATDLKTANKLYGGQGFKIIRTIAGGKTTGRKLHIRARELNTPSLFNWGTAPHIVSDLSLPIKPLSRSPQYLIDLNVIFDVVRKRANKTAANILFKAGFQNIIRIAVSEELIAELERTSKNKSDDPFLEMAKTFWCLSKPPASKIKEISAILAPIIFPDRHRDRILSTQDKSDLVHIATAIENGVAGFVTSEKKILEASDYLRSEFQIDVISVHELQELVKDVPEPERAHISQYTTRDLKTHLPNSFPHTQELTKAFKNLSIPAQALPSRDNIRSLNIRSIIISTRDNKEVAFAWWTVLTGPTPINEAYIHISGEAAQVENLIDSICERISHECSNRDVSLVKLVVASNIPNTQPALENNGFKPTGAIEPTGKVYQKICIGNVLHKGNWQKVRQKISHLTEGLLLPKEMPSISPKNRLIEIIGNNGQEFAIDFNDFELLLSPTLIVSPDISGVIVPIVKSYADDLFGFPPIQPTFLDAPEAVLKKERVYFCTPAAQRILRPGRIIFFYESGSQKNGKSAIIAAGRITQSNVVRIDDMGENLLQRGVIDRKMLLRASQSGKKTVVFFNRILAFDNPVSFKRLNELDCDDGAKFVTAKQISAQKTQQILLEGTSNV